MNLKQRFSLTFSLLFSVILATLLFELFTLFSNYRKIEIQNRLAEKAQTTVKLLVEVKAVDYALLKLIDKETINNLYNEKTLIFNDSLGLIYSSIDDAVINWDTSMLRKIQQEGYLYKTENEYDIVGKRIKHLDKNYIVLISAEDKFGNRNLVFLKYLVIVAFLAGLILVWFLSFYFSKQALLPLDVFKSRVLNISENNLSTRLQSTGSKDEISELTAAFNTMIERIDKSFQYQKSFVGNASHELRTPLSKISAQLENLMQSPELPEKFEKTMASMKEDIQQLSDIVTSLLILSKLESETQARSFSNLRIDEIIFSSTEFLRKYYNDCKIHFEIINETGNEDRLEINGDEALLRIAINNLLKNAYLYSDNKEVDIKIIQEQEDIKLYITNVGDVPEESDTDKLFGSFIRGSNAIPNKGFGLGLSIVKRIMQYHKAEIRYNIPRPRVNQMELTFKI
jgi:two-component system, OmpR family, sensor histidine kinase ArlS